MKLPSLIKKFKPEFGNVNHIRIAEKIGEMYKYIAMIERSAAIMRESHALKNKVEELEKDIVMLIKFEETKKKI